MKHLFHDIALLIYDRLFELSILQSKDTFERQKLSTSKKEIAIIPESGSLKVPQSLDPSWNTLRRAAPRLCADSSKSVMPH